MSYKNYQENDFEQFLQEEVDEHRIFPADQVWKNIRVELHGTQTWYALTFIALFIITGLTITTVFMSPGIHQLASLKLNQRLLSRDHPTENKKELNNSSNHSFYDAIAPQNITEATILKIREVQPIGNNELATNTISNNTINNTVQLEEHSLKSTSAVLSAKEAAPTALSIHTEEAEQNAVNNAEELTIPVEKPNLLKVNTPATKSIDLHYAYLKNVVSNKIIPWKKLSKIGIQFYAAVSNSYRTLEDNEVKDIIQSKTLRSNSIQNVPLGLSYSANVNDLVRHRPATGIEVGIASLYNITNKLKLKTGVQLNIQQYHIDAFKSSTKDLNTISLINTNGIQTINILSSYNNTTGNQTAQLNNQTYQLSVPIGVQWEILKGKRIGLNTEAAIQPSYLLTNNTYLLSTDYQNYADGNSLLRKWNINTNVGINISYKTGNNLIQFGPQIRYQHLPSYTNQYPIKEHLMEYGIKLGITRQWK